MENDLAKLTKLVLKMAQAVTTLQNAQIPHLATEYRADAQQEIQDIRSLSKEVAQVFQIDEKSL